MKHPIDKFFRNKLEEREFEFNPGDWQKAKTMLATQPNRRRRFLWVFLLAGLLIATLTYAYLIDDQGENSSGDIQYAKDISPSPARDHMDPSTFSSASETPKSPRFKSEKDGSEQNVQATSSRLTATNILNDKQNSAIDQSKTSNPHIRQFTKERTLADPEIGITKERQGVSLSIKSDNKNEEASGMQNALSNDVEQGILPGTKDTGGNDVESQLIVNDGARVAKAGYNINAMEVAKLSIRPFDLNELNRSPISLEKIVELTKPLSPNSFNSFGLSYVSVTHPFNNGDSKMWRGHSLNIFYIKSISPSLGLYFGLGAKYMNGDFPITQSAERFNQSNGFNFTREILQLKPEGVYYASMPVQIRKRLGRHQLATGFEMNKVLWVRANKISQTYDQNRLIGQSIDAARPETQNVSAVWMATSSFNQIQWQGMIAYRYQFNNRMSLGVGTNYMINNMVTSDTEALMPKSQKFFVNLSFEVNLWNL